MKKKSTSQSAFFNLRILTASVFCLLGIAVALNPMKLFFLKIFTWWNGQTPRLAWLSRHPGSAACRARAPRRPARATLRRRPAADPPAGSRRCGTDDSPPTRRYWLPAAAMEWCGSGRWQPASFCGNWRDIPARSGPWRFRLTAKRWQPAVVARWAV